MHKFSLIRVYLSHPPSSLTRPAPFVCVSPHPLTHTQQEKSIRVSKLSNKCEKCDDSKIARAQEVDFYFTPMVWPKSRC